MSDTETLDPGLVLRVSNDRDSMSLRLQTKSQGNIRLNIASAPYRQTYKMHRRHGVHRIARYIDSFGKLQYQAGTDPNLVMFLKSAGDGSEEAGRAFHW